MFLFVTNERETIRFPFPKALKIKRKKRTKKTAPSSCGDFCDTVWNSTSNEGAFVMSVFILLSMREERATKEPKTHGSFLVNVAVQASKISL